MTSRARKLGVALLVVLLSWAGCGDEPGGQDSSEQADEIHIPLEPRSEIAWRLVPDFDDIDDDGAGRVSVTASDFIHLARGDGYPSTVEFQLNELYDFGCVSSETGELELVDVGADGDGIAASASEDESLRLEVEEEGEALVYVEGRFEPDHDAQAEAQCLPSSNEYDELHFEIELTVDVRGVEGIELEGPSLCERTSDPVYFVGDSLLGLRVYPTDADGDRFVPSNATSHRPATLTVTAPAGAHAELAEEEAGIDGVVLPDVEATLDVEPAVGHPRTIEVVEPERVTSVDVLFELPGDSSSRILLEDGHTYSDEDELSSVGDRIVPSLDTPAMVGDEMLCSQPPVDFFELSSSTPDVCGVEERALDDYDLPFIKGENVTGIPIGQAASLHQDGTCELTLEASGLDDGQGLETDLEVTLENVDALHPMDGVE